VTAHRCGVSRHLSSRVAVTPRCTAPSSAAISTGDDDRREPFVQDACARNHQCASRCRVRTEWQPEECYAIEEEDERWCPCETQLWRNRECIERLRLRT
jgi:hypothetical protein